jgi:hypothetical protein
MRIAACDNFSSGLQKIIRIYDLRLMAEELLSKARFSE